MPIIGKFVKPIKVGTGVKKVPIIKTDNVPGKPEWFDATSQQSNYRRVMMLLKNLQQVKDNLFTRKHSTMVPWSGSQRTWTMVQ